MVRKVRKDKGKRRGPYKDIKVWKPLTCECGKKIQLNYDGRINAFHLRSVQHRYHKRLRALLSADCITYEEIGKRLGITRERVRQLGRAMGLIGDNAFERRKVCTLKKREQRIADQQARFITTLGSTRLGRFLEAAVAHGYSDNQLVEYSEESGRGGEFYSDLVVVGGKRVKVKPAWEWAPYGKCKFIRITSTRTPVDYIAYELPDSRWMFLKPWGRKKPRAESTSFSLNETFKGQKGYTLNKAHHYRDAIDAWGVLNGGS